MMLLISTRIHAVLDYIIALVLLGLPYLFDAWVGMGAKVWVPMLLGIALIVYSLVTDYELSIVALLPVPVHLMLDVVGGVLLAVSPFVFGFSHEIWAPYVVVGLVEILTAAMTERRAHGVPRLRSP
jgi:hypothetical protein